MKDFIHLLNQKVDQIDQADFIGRLCPVCDKLMTDDIMSYEGDGFHFECFQGLSESDDPYPFGDADFIYDNEIEKELCW